MTLPITNNPNIVIFGYPRAGTKLIASILSDFGYHNHGEFFDTWTSKLVDGAPVRVPELQDKFSKQLEEFPNISSYQDTLEVMKRMPSWKSQLQNHKKWTVTIWHENITSWPPLFYTFGDSFWICPKRNPWQQFLSRLIVFYNKNPDNDKISVPITIPEVTAKFHYWKMFKVSLIQDWVLRNLNSTEIQFSDLIAGRYHGFGAPYTIKSTDQHSNLEDLILNLDQVKTWYAELEVIRSNIKGKDYNL